MLDIYLSPYIQPRPRQSEGSDRLRRNPGPGSPRCWCVQCRRGRNRVDSARLPGQHNRAEYACPCRKPAHFHVGKRCRL